MPVGVPREDAVSAPPRASVPRQSSGSARPEGAVRSGLTLLVIEDNLAGGPSVPQMLDAVGGYLPGDALPGASGERIKVRTARNLTEAERLLTDDVQCILLDLALTGAGAGTGSPEPAPSEPNADSADGQPDEAGSGAGTDELEMLRHVLRLAPRHAVLALTDGADAQRAAEAVRVGAQDYLFRHELDGRLLNRAIRYAVERKRADLAQRQLTESRLRAQENARLERGLLPTPLLAGSELRFAARYRPGRSRALLGGDFYDTVRTSDGTVHAMIGDVCGHGPDEAALGVELRIAWRALTFAGLCGDQLLGTLQKVLDNERPSEEIFATLCTVDISPDGRSAGVCLAGHPSPLVAGGAGSAPRLLPYDESGPALGVVPKARWPRRQVELGGAWSMLMYTDGLIEGRIGEGRKRLGQEGMVEIVAGRMAQGVHGERLLDATMEDVRQLNGGELTDDVAVLLLDRR
ncbi:PP2C family protein-serine/threonine phosphatase [Streptomyces albidus (ex Kaewkla and Franco 2022)]|uniref:PP2C family protein-serine/threonine phosphatase n=1 Tax=Streptomyces albidus (ex Kaewkla and Franco 2022) TaxID=722709 RepID=UPI0015EF1124|nr:response regulator [Streptomyces albidus (ex Kaewkla and Franco 2022)]